MPGSSPATTAAACPAARSRPSSAGTGVATEDIREAVDALDPEQEIATARRLVEQKMAATRGQPPEARARRAAGLLARKGYPPGLVFRLIKEFLEQEGEALDLDPDQYLDPDAEATG